MVATVNRQTLGKIIIAKKSFQSDSSNKFEIETKEWNGKYWPVHKIDLHQNTFELMSCNYDENTRAGIIFLPLITEFSLLLEIKGTVNSDSLI